MVRPSRIQNDDGTPDGRVPWADRMKMAQAANYTLQNIFGPVEFWNATTQADTPGIPYVSQGDSWDPQAQLLSLPARPGAQPQLFNASTRLHVGTGDSVGIGGFIAFPYTHLLMDFAGWKASLLLLMSTRGPSSYTFV
jgi:hypothetical protein